MVMSCRFGVSTLPVSERWFRPRWQTSPRMLLRRLLFYYIDAHRQKNNETAARLAAEVRADREEMDRIYASGIVSRGDRMRRKLFLFSPALYALVVRWYEKLVIPLRQ